MSEIEKYEFEQPTPKGKDPEKHRKKDSAKPHVTVLLNRIAVPAAVRSGAFEAEGVGPLLEKWATEVVLNLCWYTVQLATLERRRKRGLAAVVTISILSLAALTLVTILHKGPDGAAFGAQAGFVITGIFLMLQVLSAATDVKAEIGIFWEASSNLKEALYSFEEAWTAVDWNTERVIAFKTALRVQIGQARVETRRERSEHFKALKSAGDVISAGMSALDQLRGKQREVYQAYQAVQTDQHAATAAKSNVELSRAVHARAVRRLEDATFANDHAKSKNAAPAYDSAAMQRLLRDVDAAAAHFEEAKANATLVDGSP